MNTNRKILILGSTGLVGSAIVRELQRKGYDNLITPPRKHFDLRSQDIAYRLIGNISPEYVFNCSAHTGGILEAIEKPAEMLLDNLYIQANVIEACRRVGVKKLLNFASSCIYPVNGKQPYREEQIGEGKTDENWSYAVAKIAGIELCRSYHKQYGCNFMTVVPCNVYGICDTFNEYSHVIPRLIIQQYHGGVIEKWNDGTQRREFIYSDDLAEACVMLMEKYNYDDLPDGVINIGVGYDVPVNDLFDYIMYASDKGMTTDEHTNGPRGVESKLMDNTIILDFGWKPKTSLEEGIKKVYSWYKENLCESHTS